MKIKTKAISTFLALLIYFTTSCSSIKSEDASKVLHNEKENYIDTNNLVKQINYKDVDFNFMITDTAYFGDALKVKCTIYNNSNKDINYINQSCNGLEYYLILNPKLFQVAPIMNCNASWGIISKIKSGDSLEFNARIIKLKDSIQLQKIDLDFRVVNKYISFDSLRLYPDLIENVYRDNIKTENIIEGEKK